MKNKPVAWRRQLDTGVYMYQEYYFGEAEPLYTHPAPTKVKFASDSCESGWIYLENTHPVKEQLTDEEILYFYKPCFYHAEDFVSEIRAILRKVCEK